jgi:sulfur relay (sulfurtransferase) complex TusBCD TusD component (DsrE family)
MANEKLGIMITKYENLQHITGTVKAARAAGYPVMIFMTDEGVRFTKDPGFLELLKVDGVDISVCDHSCERLGIHDKAEGISYGSQYNNAGMLHDSARILVF